MTTVSVGQNAAAVAQSTPVRVQDAQVVEKQVELTTEQRVRNYFLETPILAEIARCESTFRHTDSKGNILRGIENSDDVGVMQINEYYHGESAKKLGYDISTLEGNMAFAKRLYENYGTSPWSASAKCWKHAEMVAKK